MSKFEEYFKKNHLLIIGVLIAAVTLWVILKLGKSSGSSSGGTTSYVAPPVTSGGLSPVAAGTNAGPSTINTTNVSTYSPYTSSVYSPSSVSNVSDSHNIMSSYTGPVSTDSHNISTTTTTSSQFNNNTLGLPTGFAGVAGSSSPLPPEGAGYNPNPYVNAGYQQAQVQIAQAKAPPVQMGAGQLTKQTYFPSNVSAGFPVSSGSPTQLNNQSSQAYYSGTGQAYVIPGSLAVAQ